MPKKRKLLSVNDKCRICLGDDGCMGDIFAEDLRPKINDLAECTSIHINDDGNFPRNICHICLYKLDMWIDFKKQFIRSNVMLREHLELSEMSEHATSTTKRKHSELLESAIDKESPSEQSNVKKIKSESSSAAQVKPDCEAELTELTESVTVKKEGVEKEESLQKDIPESTAAEGPIEISENSSDTLPVAASVSPKVKPIAGRRAKATERRTASTKRWVARKKALLAATGENTDSDSLTSDDSQLFPRRKRIMAQALENFRMLSELRSGYGAVADSDSVIVGDTDSEKPKKNDVEKEIQDTPTNGSGQVRPASPSGQNADENVAKNSLASSPAEARKNSSKIGDDFVPSSVRSELVVDDATFIVTSTLVLSAPQIPNPAPSNNSTNAPSEDMNRERNTDIIDAVQLRRVSPKSPEKRDKKFLESCLSIEVEGTELDALQRVQTDLANFVENEMKTKFADGNFNTEKSEVAKDSFQTLDRQLKTIVEKAIKKNLENTRNVANNRGNNTFTSEFVKAALRSRIFQPKVSLLRLDVARLQRESEQKATINKAKTPKIEKVEKNVANTAAASLSISRGKRRCVQPLKYADFDTSPIDSDVEESRDLNSADPDPKTTSPGPKSSKVKTYGPATAKQIQPAVNNLRETQKTKNTPQTSKSSSTAVENSAKISTTNCDESTGEKHMCGVCGESFGTRREVEIHFVIHKNSPAASSKQPKLKMMRCKRCHEIVEARYVKMHVCRALRSIFKCYSCNSSFKTENMLTLHLAEHSFDDRDGKIDLVPRKEAKIKTKSERIVDEPETDGPATERSNSLVVSAARESYTCFVCDKTFTDEEILKDHLQMHCDDMSDDQRSNGKDYQCAICGESLESEDALETHVEKHLFDDEDDNPNLISIGANNENDAKITASETARCGQCDEEFDSEMLLMLHMQAHDEEVAIAEWERRGIDNSQHICVICDDVFATEIELSDHLEAHNGNAHICQLCDKPFLTLEELQSHVETH